MGHISRNHIPTNYVGIWDDPFPVDALVQASRRSTLTLFVRP